MEDAGIKKAGIFSLIFSQKMGIMATAAPKWKSFRWEGTCRHYAGATPTHWPNY